MPNNKRLPNFPDQIRSGLTANTTVVLRGQALVYASDTDSETVKLGTANNEAKFAGVALMDSANPGVAGQEISYVAGGDVEIRCSGAIAAGDPICVAANGSFKTAVATNKEVCGHATVTGADGDVISAHINQTRGLAVS